MWRKSYGSCRTSSVQFNILCLTVVPAAFVVSLIWVSHPLSNLQLLQSVLVHFPFSQEEADYTCWEAYHPGRRRERESNTFMSVQKLSTCCSWKNWNGKCFTRGWRDHTNGFQSIALMFLPVIPIINSSLWEYTLQWWRESSVASLLGTFI